MTIVRDISKAQYEKRMNELGFLKDGFMGYWRLPEPLNNLLVSDLNAGDRRRAKLAYMLKEWDRAKTKAIGLTK